MGIVGCLEFSCPELSTRKPKTGLYLTLCRLLLKEPLSPPVTLITLVTNDR